MSAENETAALMSLLRSEYARLDDCGEIGISPALLAAKALDAIDPAGASPVLVRIAASLELRQLARSVCRAQIEDEDDEEATDQGELFAVRLQFRYPATRGGDEIYVLRDHLTIAERRSNSERLRREGAAKVRHARALDAETEKLIASGILHEAA